MSRDSAAARGLKRQRLERFIGVVYRPDTELVSHYAQASLSQQFDAFLWFDEGSAAVTPLGLQHTKAGLPTPILLSFQYLGMALLAIFGRRSAYRRGMGEASGVT